MGKAKKYGGGGIDTIAEFFQQEVLASGEVTLSSDAISLGTLSFDASNMKTLLIYAPTFTMETGDRAYFHSAILTRLNTAWYIRGGGLSYIGTWDVKKIECDILVGNITAQGVIAELCNVKVGVDNGALYFKAGTTYKWVALG